MGNDQDLQQPVTIGDLIDFKKELMQDMMEALSINLLSKLPLRQGYSIREFSQYTGLEESTLINYCLAGKLKAKQLVKGGKWVILTSELDRLIREAVNNHFNTEKKPGKRDSIILKKLGIKVNK